MRFLILLIFLTNNVFAKDVSEIKNIVIHKDPKVYDNVIFLDKKDKRINLNEFNGNLILLNFWATWCEPCKEEMPSLDKLQAYFDQNEFVVLPINLDRGPKKKALNFFDDFNINNIQTFFDDKNSIPREVKILGLPVTLLINKNGLEVARLIGPTEWTDEKILELIRNEISN